MLGAICEISAILAKISYNDILQDPINFEIKTLNFRQGVTLTGLKLITRLLSAVPGPNSPLFEVVKGCSNFPFSVDKGQLKDLRLARNRRCTCVRNAFGDVASGKKRYTLDDKSQH